MIKAAIFDMDGLLIDSERIIMQACIQAAAQVGITYTQAEYVELIGRAGPDSTRIMVEQLNGVENFNLVMQGLDALLAQRNHMFPLKTGAQALLEYYQANQIICSVASSSPMHHITHRLNHVGVLNHFSHLTSGQEVERGKPNPDIYLLAVNKLGLSPQACIAFEDSEMGARAAIAAGLKVVVVPDLLQPSDYVRAHCHQVVESLQDWLNAIAPLNTMA
ncbi:haloacid dehalogenase superfamily protein, subfamily IA, variant 3 with third motif having DD or ED [Methylophilaceae bacterium 11]|uniref:HAD family hydrolase n=1 Tax=Methylotenera sp. 1P/1 TaxID=1131551 RepID=UPI00044C43AF|nr:HAD family phosphatase [Methylotenera sp. 1P/1]EUJ09455.1 haloacid dehalogenase superfamily protein, subfamily IA, variant 3 with third motif having DD or ED [Methylophilaceae bacterium 11]